MLAAQTTEPLRGEVTLVIEGVPSNDNNAETAATVWTGFEDDPWAEPALFAGVDRRALIRKFQGLRKKRLALLVEAKLGIDLGAFEQDG